MPKTTSVQWELVELSALLFFTLISLNSNTILQYEKNCITHEVQYQIFFMNENERKNWNLNPILFWTIAEKQSL